MSACKADADLEQLQISAGVTATCKSFIGELKHIFTTLGVVRGRPSISRKVTRLIFYHFAKFELPILVEAQQRHIRKRCGQKIAVDNTYHAGRSLVGAAADARTVTGKRKMTPFSASVLTVSVENGFIVATVIVPNDGQEHAVAAIEALYGGPPREGLLHEMIHAIVRPGGHLHNFPKVICTDFVSRDLNLWQRAAHRVVQGCVEHGVDIRIPTGANLLSTCQHRFPLDVCKKAMTCSLDPIALDV